MSVQSDDIKNNACDMCPRKCMVSRSDEGHKGYCGVSGDIKIARYSLHMWEEPCISGEAGSGTIFFSGCNLRCIYCQNMRISRGETGQYITENQLEKIMWKLAEMGANNINLVTPSHYIRQIARVLENAKQNGFTLPIVYNTSSYENVQELKRLEGLVDIYLPDFKYMDDELACDFSGAANYKDIAMKGISEMYRQTGPCQFDDENGLIKKGVIVRNLLLPLQVANTKRVIEYLYETYGNNIFISIMSQYTPPEKINICSEKADKKHFKALERKVTKREYEAVLSYAIALGIENAFIQEEAAASESFIPDFYDKIDIPE